MHIIIKRKTQLIFLILLCLTIVNCSDEDSNNITTNDIANSDSDQDGVTDNNDNCITLSNPEQIDTDNDGMGDECDDDDDNDGIVDSEDNCPLTYNPEQTDTDNDSIGDVCDDDDDNDGILDIEDNCPLTANPDQIDLNNNNIGDICENNSPLHPCENGMAGIYPCNNYDLLGQISTFILSGNSQADGSDIWGWTDPVNQKEYAIFALTNSTAFVDITNPYQPLFLGRLMTNSGTSYWRDVKIYNNHAFIVADNVGAHGMQVFDLTRLRNLTSIPATFTADTTFNGVDSCHNIVINENEGVAYLVGCSNNGGGPIFVDITNPLNPTYLGEYATAGYSHDAQVVTYNGPDTDYTGHQIYVGSNGNTDQVVILDVTDKNNIIQISNFSYPQTAYAHQGWFTEDQAFFILGDEVDEMTYGFNTKTLVFDFTDLDNPSLSSTYFGTTPAIDHNGYVKGDEYYLANYRAGLRVLDISNISASSNALVETGYFDSYPADDNPDFNGAWSVYPYFESGNIIIGDIDAGLLIVRKSN